MKEGSVNESVKRAVTALFDRYRAVAAPEIEELQRLIDGRTRTRGELSETNLHERHLPLAKKCKDVLVSAHNTFITPSGSRWFNIRSRKRKKNRAEDSTTRWYSKCSEITFDELAESNFYPCIHEVYNDRCTGGTGACYVGGDEAHPLFFVHIPLGSFAIAEDNKGRVNTLARRFYYTAQQAVEEWGYDILPKYVQDNYDNERKRYTERIAFVHFVRPRANHVKGWHNIPEERREYEGFYVDEKEYNIIKTEGYYEFPFLVTRFLRGADSPYGEAPGLSVLPIIRQYIKLDKLMDVQAEIAAFPRILQLAGQNRQVDVRAGGVTTVSEEEARLGYPREWATGARYDAGLERLKDKGDEIRGAFYVDMLNSISEQDKVMTAREISARESERVLAFSSSFTAFIYDHQAMMRRVMGILMRREAYPEEGMPAELFETRADGGEGGIVNPNVSYLGKIAQAIEIVMQRGIDQVIEKVLTWVQATQDPYMLKLIKQSELLRAWVESSGATVDILLNHAEEQELETQMQAQAQAAGQMQEAAAAAELENKQSQTVRNLRA